MNRFIDDIIKITIDDPLWVERAKKADLLLAIHTIFRPIQYSEPLKQDEPLPLHKIAGEG